jgi:diadenylate cyclase
LTDFVESGTALESKISSELLINIFIPNTPLHDGAVIIRGGQIMAAGCYLPLSENPFISKELGTRHRAAIGMSEVSDALCVVVSEETGQVSVTLNGHILRDVQEDALIAKLFEELKPKKTTDKYPFWKWRGRQNG